MNSPLFGFLRTPIGRKIRLAAVIFALLFSLSAMAQYLFVLWQLNRTRQSEFQKWAEELKTELDYTTKWDLKKFRQADWDAPGCYVFDRNGLLLDIETFVPSLLGQVTLPGELNYETPTNIMSEIGESWRILGRKIRGGVVLVGISQTNNMSDVDGVLRDNAKEFGTTIEEASKVRSRDINKNVDYCVIDASGNLQSATGGIPLRTTSRLANIKADSTIHLTLNGRHYSVFSTPILDISSNSVGSIAIPRDDTLEQQTLRNSVSFNIVLAMVSWVVLGGLTVNYFLRYEATRRMHEIPLEELLKRKESDTLEFKSSVRWDYNLSMLNKDLEGEIVETVAAFLNTLGGVLVIGIRDDKSILGLQPDYDSSENIRSRDGFERHLQQIVSKQIGIDRYQSHISVEFHELEGKEVCAVRVKPAPKPVVISKQNRPSLYVRTGNATRSLNVEEAIRYVQEHWAGYV
jgi:Putative DNA-binding domain